MKFKNLYLFLLFTLICSFMHMNTVEAAFEEYEAIPNVRLKENLKTHPDVHLDHLANLPSRLYTIVDDENNYYFCLDEGKLYPDGLDYTINQSSKIDSKVYWLVKNFYDSGDGIKTGIASYDNENFYTQYAATQIAIWTITNSNSYVEGKPAHKIITQNEIVSDLVAAAAKNDSTYLSFEELISQINAISASLTEIVKINETNETNSFKTTLDLQNMTDDFFVDEQSLQTKVIVIDEDNSQTDITEKASMRFDHKTNELTLVVSKEDFNFETATSTLQLNVQASIRSKEDVYIAYSSTSKNTQSVIGKNKLNRILKDNTQINEENKTSYSVSKRWQDGNNQDGLRQAAIDVQLYQNGEAFGDPQGLNNENGWSYTWTHLDELDTAGQVITYEAKELSQISGYEAHYVNQDKDNVEIVNVHNIEKVSVNIHKKWDDGENLAGVRPTSIQVNLYGNNELITSAELKEDNWAHTFTDLPKYENGKEIIYTVEEVDIPNGYKATVDATDPENITITNSYVPSSTEIIGEKVWVDNDNQDGLRPDSITVNLLANGELKEQKIVTAEDGWSYAFTNLPEYQDGEKIKYTVTENHVENYTTKVEGTTIVNHYTPGKTSATVTKFWEDRNDQARLRPDNIRVQLYANDELFGTEITLSEANNWTYTWEELDEKAAEQTIVYTVQEIDVPNEYEVSVDVSDMGNMIITNHYESIFVVDGASGKRPNGNNAVGNINERNTLPDTGEKTSVYYVLIASMMLVGILMQQFSVIKSKRN